MVSRHYRDPPISWIVAALCTLVLAAATTPAPAACVAPAICAFIDHDYIDQRRLDPTLLAAGVMTALHQMKPGVTATWGPQGLILHQVDQPDRLMQRRAPSSLKEVAGLIRDLVECFPAAADCPCRDFEYVLINGALACLDPYTKVLPPMQARALDDELKGGFGQLDDPRQDGQGHGRRDGPGGRRQARDHLDGRAR